MGPLDELSAAILADLDADAPRLVLADALQTAGDPRGELIAIQCELARLGCDRTRVAAWRLNKPSHVRRDWIADALITDERERIAALRLREHQLLSVHDAAWRTVPQTCRWGRGFIDHAYDGDLAWNALVFDETPMIRSLECSIEEADLDEPRLAQLRQLRVSNIDNTLIPRLLDRAWPNLRELSLSSTSGEDDFVSIRALLATSLLAQLEGLDLSHDVVLPSHLVEVLERAPLRHLRLGSHLFGPPLLEALSSCERAQTLEILDLVMLDGSYGYRWLANPQSRSNRLAGLRALRIFEEREGWLEAGMLVGCGELPALRVLDLGGNPLAEGVRELVVCEFASLVQLGLADCNLKPAHAAQLALSPWLDRLITLDLRDNHLLAEHLAPLRERNPRLEILA